MLRIRYIILLFTFFVFHQAFGNNVRFQSISTEHGLSQSTINNIIQDDKGFIWFGSWDGLNRYDGYEFKMFKPIINDTNSISHNVIRSLFIDSKDNLWIGTEGGLNKYNAEDESFTRFLHSDNENSISNDLVYTIFEDNKNNLWVGTKGGGLNKYVDSIAGFKRIINNTEEFRSNLWVNYIYCLINDPYDPDNYLWIGTEGGMYRFNLKNESLIPKEKDVSPITSINDVVMSVHNDGKGYIWIGTWGKGLIKYNIKTKELTRYSNIPGRKETLSNDIVMSVLSTSNGDLFVATRGGGLNKYDYQTGNFNCYNVDPSSAFSIPDNFILNLYEDKSGIVWIGTYKAGVARFDYKQKPFYQIHSNYLDKNSLNDNSVNCILEDNKGNLWLGTQNGGVNTFYSKRGKYVQYKNIPDKKNSLSNNTVQTIYIDESGIVWAGTDGGGLNRFDVKTNSFKSYLENRSSSEDLSNGHIYSFICDNNGIYWIGTWGAFRYFGGIDLFDKKTEKFFHLPNQPFDSLGVSKNIILSIYQDSKNRIWAGSKGEGVNLITLKNSRDITDYVESITVYRHNDNDTNSLGHNDVFCISETSDGVIWIGTGGGGICKFDETTKTFTNYSEKDGLPNGIINSIIVDDHDKLWLSTGNGISVFNPETEKFKNYDVNDGLQGNVFNRGAGYKNKDGIIYFGGIYGVTYFNPDSIVDNNYVPPVVITDFKLFNQPVKVDKKYGKRVILHKSITETKSITLPYKQNVFTISFSALNYSVSEKNLYKYRLENFNDEWIEVKASQRSVTYTNLDPGEYVFHVLGSNNDNHWNNIGTELKITVLPPFYKSLGFNITLFVIIILVVLFFVNRIISKYKKERDLIAQQAKESIFDERNQLHTLIDNLPDYIYIKDRESRFVVINEKLAGVMGGKRPKEWVGKTDFDFYEKDMARKYYSDEQELMETGEPIVNMEEPGVDEEGRAMFLLTTKIPLKNAEGKIVGLVGIGRDISDLKKTQKKLLEQSQYLKEINTLLEERQEEITKQTEELSEHRRILTEEKNLLRTIIDHIPDMIYVIDRESKVITGNKEFVAQKKAKTIEEIKGKTDFDFYSKIEEAQKRFDDEKHIMETGEAIINKEESNIDGDGNVGFVLTTKVPFKNENNEIMGIVGIGRDITVQKKNELKLIEQAEYLKEINVLLEERQEEVYQQSEELSAQAENLKEINNELEKMSIIAQKTDNSVRMFDVNGTIIYVNEGFCKLYELEFQEVINKNALSDMGDYFSPDFKINFNVCIESKRACTYEAKATRKGGGEFWLQTTLTPILNENNDVIKLIALDTDISILKKAQEEIQLQSDELRKLNATKDKFFSIIAHDLKNPFHAIIGFTDLLNHNFDNINDKEKQELIELVNTTSKSTYNLLENLLHWARTQTQSIKFTPDKVNISDLVKDNIRFVQLNLDKKGINLKNHFDKEVYVNADYNMLNTILRNLISNAVKFTEQNGEVTIGYSEKEADIEFYVKDTGIGMEENVTNSLFDIKGYRSTTGTFGETGTGLGLVICKEFVAKHNGKIFVESELGKGSTFYCSLPKFN